MTVQTSCPLCRSESLVVIVEREQVPVHQNLVFRSQQAALNAVRSYLSIVACTDCGFVFNRTFDLSKLEYGSEYDNTQLVSPAFQVHVKSLVDRLVHERGVRNAQIVEVGCGKGAFIRALVEVEGANNVGIGFDPSYVGPDTDLEGRLRFERRFYDESCTSVPADVVVSRHVIEHVPEPITLLQSIAAALRDRPGARIFLETPCVAWILGNGVVWDFFYEHCSLFTARSLSMACEAAGFTVERASHVFNGQYLWVEAVNTPPSGVRRDPGRVAELAVHFSRAHQEKSERWVTMVRELAATQQVAIWGAGAKGVTFANLVDPHRQYVSCVIDVNPAKQGGYIPGTGHPIVAPEELSARQISSAILLNPSYKDEILAYLQSHALPVELLDIGAI